MASAGQVTYEILDDFPKTTRVGAPTGRRETDVDIALAKYVEDGAQGALKVIDYNVEDDTDAEGNVVGVKAVDNATARARAGGRVGTLKSRGYTIDEGWVIVSRNGMVFAKYFGAGQVPDEYIKQEKAVGEAVPV